MYKSKIIAYALCVILAGCLVYAAVNSDSKKYDTGGQNSTVSEDIAVKKQLPSNIVEPDENGDLCFTVATHDLGYFNYSTALHYEGEDVDAQYQNWKSVINGYDVDFFFCQEYQLYFDADYRLGADGIFKDKFKNYDNIYANAYGAVGIMSQHRQVDRYGIDLIADVDGYVGPSRPCVIASSKINGNFRIWLASFSLFNDKSSETAPLARKQQLQMLLNNRWIKESEYAILAGNFNSDDGELAELLAENGYTLCNNGIPTTDKKGAVAIDNIAVKGFEVVECSVYPDKRCTSNHYPVVAKLKLVRKMDVGQ